MRRDLSRDGQLFNCTQPHEIDYVVSQYPDYENRVRLIIDQGCTSGALKYYTHLDVHQYVQRHLGLEEL